MGHSLGVSRGTVRWMGQLGRIGQAGHSFLTDPELSLDGRLRQSGTLCDVSD